uniref:Centrosomal protein 20 n=1 Tax=Arion vulgaris TaxID=1028688 RepID=A0A0B7B5Q3_9EUPU
MLKESLENRGSLAEIKARLRAEVFTALDDPSEMKPAISNDNLLIFELIREFLDYNHCKYSTSVLVSEVGLPKVPLDREFLRHELNIVEDAPSKSVPLLYSLVSSYKDNNMDRVPKVQGFTKSLDNLRATSTTHKVTSDNYESVPVIVKGGKL